MSYTVLQKCLLVFFIAYFSIGIGVHFFYGGERKIYPFFSWFLFSHVPWRVETGFDIRIHRTGETRYDPPVLFERAKDVYDTSYNEMAYYNTLIQALALAVRRHDEQEIMRIRKQLEATFLLRPVVYEVVEITYEPQKRWQRGEIIQSATIQTFETQP